MLSACKKFFCKQIHGKILTEFTSKKAFLFCSDLTKVLLNCLLFDKKGNFIYNRIDIRRIP